KAMSSNRQLSWPGSEGGLLSNIIEEEHEGVNTQEKIHGAMYPIQIYPLFENALRAEKGISIEEHNKNLADFCAEFSNIASENPYAWFREKKSSREIGQITDANRMIGFPYPKFMNSIMNVNQAAGVIVTSNEIAEKLSIPKNKWVYLHGGAEANDKWFVSDRVSYTISPAIREISKTALEMAGITLDQIDFFDLYSCFPCAPIIAAKSMGMDLNTLPPLTITGGLPYFGGAGNNYSMHAIAQAVEMLRKNPNNFGYISALGWFITKHAAGIYSGIEPQRPWDRSGFPDIQQKIEDMDSPEICEAPEGPATVETYTVIHDRQGKPDNAIIIARLDDARRCWAKTKDDQELLLSMGKEEFIGKKGFVSPGNNSPNIMRFK
ncbi:MAG: acetyl-CoA acetyltransferase, partial [Spirochaetota bacterium]|nr:acetyl-CoA acetyltransferase [Spirochaetota bacterium]